MRNRMWQKAIVLKGTKDGRTIGFPTVNLAPQRFAGKLNEGVYSTFVVYKGKKYSGVLYFGPRLVKGEKHPVLEIHILGFNKEIYGKTITFSIGRHIREVMNFKSLDELKKQIKRDIDVATLGLVTGVRS